MKLAVAQLRSIAGDIAANLAKHVDAVRRAVELGAELLLFPELSLTGYEPTLAQRLAIRSDDSRFDVLQALSDGSVSVCLLVAVLTCIPNDADQLALVDEVRRVLASVGTVWATDYCLQEYIRNETRYAQAQGQGSTYGVFTLPDGARFRHHRRDWIDQLFSTFVDLTIVDTQLRTTT